MSGNGWCRCSLGVIRYDRFGAHCVRCGGLPRSVSLQTREPTEAEKRERMSPPINITINAGADPCTCPAHFPVYRNAYGTWCLVCNGWRRIVVEAHLPKAFEVGAHRSRNWHP